MAEHALSAPWVCDSAGVWSIPPGFDTVALSATEGEDPDELTDEERQRLADSPEWTEFVVNEVDHYLAMLDELR